MTKGEFFKKIENYPDDMEIVIFDWKKNFHNASEEQNGIGVYSEFEVHAESAENETIFIALMFDNEEYNEDGSKIE